MTYGNLKMAKMRFFTFKIFLYGSNTLTDRALISEITKIPYQFWPIITSKAFVAQE